MVLNLVNLDADTRNLMLQEIERDISDHKLYPSERLSIIGRRDYPDLLKQAANPHDDAWLATQLRQAGRLNATEQSHDKSGNPITKDVPSNAADLLAEDEFNRFYLRALSLRAIRDGIPSLIIYRARQVSNPRPESERRIGQTINPNELLNDLRTNIGKVPNLRLPQIGSGLSAKLP